MEILMIIPVLMLALIILLQMNIIEQQKREIEAGTQAFKNIAKKYRALKNGNQS